MSRKYTAQEMRDMAENILMSEDDWIEDAGHMLRQAADEMEREDEREKKCQYQYAARYLYPGEIIATDHIFDNPTDAKRFSYSRDGAQKIICRREVGEWEEMPNEG